MKEKNRIRKTLGKAHIVCHHDAGKPKLLFQPLDQVSEPLGDDRSTMVVGSS